MIFILFREKLSLGKINSTLLYVFVLNIKNITFCSGKEVAVIYGGLPPGTKLAQAAKFNDVSNSCKVMVATDAIGMGLNL